MQEEYLFSGTPAEFGTTAETFSDREDTKAGLVRFWVDRPHQANRSIWDARLGIKSPIHQDAVSLSGGFALDSPTIGGKNAGYRAMVVLRVQSTRVGTLIIVTGEDSAWATLSPYWNQFTEYLRKFGWQLIPLGEEEQAAGGEVTEVLGRRAQNYRNRIVCGLILWLNRKTGESIEDICQREGLVSRSAYFLYQRDGLIYTDADMTKLSTDFATLWAKYKAGQLESYIVRILDPSWTT